MFHVRVIIVALIREDKMLFKTKQIPPGLVKIVRTEKGSKKSLFLIGASILTVAIGFVLVFVYNQYLIPELKKSKGTQQIPVVQQTSVAQVEPSREKEYTQARIEPPPAKTKPEKAPSQKVIKSSAKPDEIPLEQFNTETVKGADYLYRAQDFETRGSYSDAISEYKEYLKVTGKQEPKILNKIATLYLLLGNLTEASHYAEQSLKQAPDNPSVILNYGVIQAKMGNLSKAEECFRKVLSAYPENKTALFNLALLKEKKKEYEEALKLYEKLYQLGDTQAAEAIQRIRSYK